MDLHSKIKPQTKSYLLGILFVVALFGGLIGVGVDPFWLLIHNESGMVGLILSLTLISLYFRYQYEVPAGAVLKYLGMPLGFIFSTILAIDLIQEDASFIVSLSPAVVGAIVSALFLDREFPKVLVPRWSRNWDFLVFGLITIGCVFVGSVQPLWILAQPFAWIVAISCVGMVFFFLRRERELDTKLLEASLYGLLISVAISLLVYMSAVLAFCDNCNLEEQRKGGSILLCHILYPLFIYLIALLNSLAKGNTEKLIRSNWHLAEGYVFIIFIIFAPQSLVSF
jgi:hypothetical protein